MYKHFPGLTIAALFLIAAPAQADFTNGGFEASGLAPTGWATLGVSSIETAAFGTAPTGPTNQLLLTNATGSSIDAAIEVFLGLSAGTLDGLSGGNATEGSAASQVVTVSAGDTLTFDWNFLTNESTGNTFNDFAFVTLVDMGSMTTVLADTFFPVFAPSGTVFTEETGYSTFTHVFASGGTFTFGLGVMDKLDTGVDSGLLIDGAVITPIPAPGAVLLGAMGLGLVGWVKRRFS